MFLRLLLHRSDWVQSRVNRPLKAHLSRAVRPVLVYALTGAGLCCGLWSRRPRDGIARLLVRQGKCRAEFKYARLKHAVAVRAACRRVLWRAESGNRVLQIDKCRGDRTFLLPVVHYLPLDIL